MNKKIVKIGVWLLAVLAAAFVLSVAIQKAKVVEGAFPYRPNIPADHEGNQNCYMECRAEGGSVDDCWKNCFMDDWQGGGTTSQGGDAYEVDRPCRPNNLRAPGCYTGNCDPNVYPDMICDVVKHSDKCHCCYPEGQSCDNDNECCSLACNQRAGGICGPHLG